MPMFEPAMILSGMDRMDETLRCWYCAQVIGLYEPMVVFAEGEWHETSLSREQHEAPVGDCYHRACFREYRRGWLDG